MVVADLFEESIDEWGRATLDERIKIREKVEKLRAESNNWGPFYGEHRSWLYRKTRKPYGLLADLFEWPEDQPLKDGPWLILELAVFKELQNPKALAWERASKYLLEAMNDPEIQVNPETVKVIQSWFDTLDWASGSASAEEVAPPEELIATRARSEDAANKASKKNAYPRAWVLTEWESRPDPGQKKAPFARQYVPLVKKRFGVLVTEDTIKRDWLPKSGK